MFNENHEILCPPELQCPICDLERMNKNTSRITELFSSDDIQIFTKHFYMLSISLTPKRETYHHFSLEPVKKSSRELVNGLSSISSISNRKWWSMFIEGGVRYYSVTQNNEEDYPTFSTNLICVSQKDNLDTRIQTQLKYRLRKICSGLNFSFDYLGNYNPKILENIVKPDISVFWNSNTIEKLGSDIKEEIIKLKEQRPTIFGDFHSKRINNKNKILTTI
jgi:hypothetical protein